MKKKLLEEVEKNRTDLEVSISHCRCCIENRLIAIAEKRTDVDGLMDDIDHLCNLRVCLAVEMCPGNMCEAIKDLVVR